MNFVLAIACEAKSWRVRPPRRGRSSRRLREEATIPSFKHKKKTRHHIYRGRVFVGHVNGDVRSNGIHLRATLSRVLIVNTAIGSRKPMHRFLHSTR
jgi:hypothetical protein